jgi:hypothetical protein
VVPAPTEEGWPAQSVENWTCYAIGRGGVPSDYFLRAVVDITVPGENFKHAERRAEKLHRYGFYCKPVGSTVRVYGFVGWSVVRLRDELLNAMPKLKSEYLHTVAGDFKR